MLAGLSSSAPSLPPAALCFYRQTRREADCFLLCSDSSNSSSSSSCLLCSFNGTLSACFSGASKPGSAAVLLPPLPCCRTVPEHASVCPSVCVCHRLHTHLVSHPCCFVTAASPIQDCTVLYFLTCMACPASPCAAAAGSLLLLSPHAELPSSIAPPTRLGYPMP